MFKDSADKLLCHARNYYLQSTIIRVKTLKLFRKSLSTSTSNANDIKNDNKRLPKASFKKINCNSIDKDAEVYKQNYNRNENLLRKYEKVLALSLSGGNDKAKLWHKKQNKLLIDERLKLLFDDYDQVLELSPISGLNMEYGTVPRAGTVTAIGKIGGIYCMVTGHDATVKAGTVYPISLKKQLRAQEIFFKNKLPCIYIVDSGGAFLPLQTEIFPDKHHGGRAFYNEAIASSLDIPQIAIVSGSCTAGAAYIPSMCEEAAIVDKIGTIFLAGPPLVKAALGQDVTPEQLGGASLHCGQSGVTDYFCRNEYDAMELAREITLTFNITPEIDDELSTRKHLVEAPLYEMDEIFGLLNDDNAIDCMEIFARIFDGSRFHEFKSMFGRNLKTGFGFIKGRLVGIVGVNGKIKYDEAVKGSHFVQLCTRRRLPIVFLQNSSIGTDHHTYDDIDIKAHAQLMSSIACSQSDKITIIIGNSFGLNNFLMPAGRSFDPNFLFCWPNARISFDMDVDHKSESVCSKTTTVYDAFHSTSRCWDDGIVLPTNTRETIFKCLKIFQQKNINLNNSLSNNNNMSHAVYRM